MISAVDDGGDGNRKGRVEKDGDMFENYRTCPRLNQWLKR